MEYLVDETLGLSSGDHLLVEVVLGERKRRSSGKRIEPPDVVEDERSSGDTRSAWQQWQCWAFVRVRRPFACRAENGVAVPF